MAGQDLEIIERGVQSHTVRKLEKGKRSGTAKFTE